MAEFRDDPLARPRTLVHFGRFQHEVKVNAGDVIGLDVAARRPFGVHLSSELFRLAERVRMLFILIHVESDHVFWITKRNKNNVLAYEDPDRPGMYMLYIFKYNEGQRFKKPRTRHRFDLSKYATDHRLHLIDKIEFRVSASLTYRNQRSPSPRPRDRTERSPDRRRADRSPDRRLTDLSPDRRRADRSLDRRLTDLSPDRRRADRSLNRRRADFSPDRRLTDRSLDRRLTDLSPDRHRADRSLDRRRADLSPDRRRADLSPDRRHANRDQQVESGGGSLGRLGLGSGSQVGNAGRDVGETATEVFDTDRESDRLITAAVRLGLGYK
jgi:hypothetical protein